MGYPRYYDDNVDGYHNRQTNKLRRPGDPGDRNESAKSVTKSSPHTNHCGSM